MCNGRWRDFQTAGGVVLDAAAPTWAIAPSERASKSPSRPAIAIGLREGSLGRSGPIEPPARRSLSHGPAFANVPRRTETGRNGGSVFPLRRSAGRLYSLNRADCLHD